MRLLKPKPPVRAVDPRLLAIQDADAEYHRLCIDLHDPMVPIEELPLEELAATAQRIVTAIEGLQSQMPSAASGNVCALYQVA